MTITSKHRAAAAALEDVKDGMVLGLGTGSTAAKFVDLLADRVRTGLDVRGVPTSDETAARARAGGIELIEPDETTVIDLAIDGADEVDPRGDLIKGGGGALLREKIVARAARRFVVIADRGKAVSQLGAFPLPIEIVRFGYGLTVAAVREALAAEGYPDAPIALRPRPAAAGVFLSDNGNYILDVHLGRIENAARLAAALEGVPGVITSGLFVGMTRSVYLGDGQGVERLDV